MKLSNVLHYIVEAHMPGLTVTRWGLGTEDAHGLYQKFGFKVLSNPNSMMEKIINN